MGLGEWFRVDLARTRALWARRGPFGVRLADIVLAEPHLHLALEYALLLARSLFPPKGSLLVRGGSDEAQEERA